MLCFHQGLLVSFPVEELYWERPSVVLAEEDLPLPGAQQLLKNLESRALQLSGTDNVLWVGAESFEKKHDLEKSC